MEHACLEMYVAMYRNITLSGNHGCLVPDGSVGIWQPGSLPAHDHITYHSSLCSQITHICEISAGTVWITMQLCVCFFNGTYDKQQSYKNFRGKSG